MLSGGPFIRQCKTNVHVAEDMLALPCASYRPQQPSLWTLRNLYNAVAYLRANNVLCTVQNDQLLIFGSPDPHLLGSLSTETYCFLEAEDNAPESAEPVSLNGESKQNALLESIEGSLAFTLAKTHGVVHVEPWTWLFLSSDRDEAGDGNSTLLEMRTSLSEVGDLYLSHTQTPTSLHPVKADRHPSSVLLACCGRTAKPLATHATNGAGSRVDMGHASEATAWKSMVGAVLAAEGIRVDNDEQWSSLELLQDGRTTSIVWPARLCLNCSAADPTRAVSKGRPSWRQWVLKDPSADATEVFHDPLSWAEDWFRGSAQRSEAESGLIEEGHAQSGTFQTPAMPVDGSPLTTSSPFAQRLVDAQASFSGVYPTPPDGFVAPSAIIQLGSQPGSQPDGIAENLLNIEDSQAPTLEDGQREQSLALDTMNETRDLDQSPNDLFGDSGVMDFNTNEVAEADFDYFDGPDTALVTAVSNQKGSEPSEQGAPNDIKGTDPDEEQDPLLLDEPQGQASLETSAGDGLSESGLSSQLPHDVNHTIPSNDFAMVDIPKERARKPLSPFEIREQLLPLPIPASATKQAETKPLRSRAYGSIDFNRGFDVSSKYALYSNHHSAATTGAVVPSIGLAKTGKRRRSKSIGPGSRVPKLVRSDSSDDSSEDDMDVVENVVASVAPPWLPWDGRESDKADAAIDARGLGPMNGNSRRDANILQSIAHATEMLNGLFTPNGKVTRLPPGLESFSKRSLLPANRINSAFGGIPPPQELFGLDGLDLIHVAQLIMEQAASTSPTFMDISNGLDGHAEIGRLRSEAAIEDVVDDTLARNLPGLESCALWKLTPTKEWTSQTPAGTVQSPQKPHPRHGPRARHFMATPYILHLVAPYLRVQRGSELWELLPPALTFWSTLGLSPANGPKDIQVLFVVPDHSDLVVQVGSFMGDLRNAYESQRLGAFDVLDHDDVHNGIHIIGAAPMADRKDDQDDLGELRQVLKSYKDQCVALGERLADNASGRLGSNVLICFVNPFDNDTLATHYLSACFQSLHTAFLAHLPKSHKQALISNLVLQILPVSWIVSSGQMEVEDRSLLAALATEIYDRIPTSTNNRATAKQTSALSSTAAPAVQLAPMPPKKIAFQLSADPPSDLLQEGSVLHIAYAQSRDEKWLTICWIEETGRDQRTRSISVQGRSLDDAVLEAWELTFEILAAREVMWRVLIVAIQDVDDSLAACWRRAATSKPRKQMLHVSLLLMDAETLVHLTPSQSSELNQASANATTPGGGVLTPASTPRAPSHAPSPDQSGQAHTPSTPTAMDAATNLTEADPEAYLVDHKLESWGLLISPSFALPRNGSKCPVNGLIVHRLERQADQLACVGVGIHWDIRIRPNGLVDDSPLRQSEANLRETLRMYRNLALLTKIRRLDVPRDESDVKAGMLPVGVLPIHVVHALAGARALNHLLRQ